jgi:hypothetical protein
MPGREEIRRAVNMIGENGGYKAFHWAGNGMVVDKRGNSTGVFAQQGTVTPILSIAVSLTACQNGKGGFIFVT